MHKEYFLENIQPVGNVNHVFPDIRDKHITIDLETHDPNLSELGPGEHRDDSYILGIGILTANHKVYIPFNHPDFENNVSQRKFAVWFQSIIPGCTILGQNIGYDIGFLQTKFNIDFSRCYLMDTQVNEALIDENRSSYSLDSLAQKYLNRKKGIDKLKLYCEERGWKDDPRKHLAKINSRLVGDYCIQDCIDTLEVCEKQLPILKATGLETVLDLECRFIKVRMLMRSNGIRFDIEEAERQYKYLDKEGKLRESKLIAANGGPINLNRSVELVDLFKAHGKHIYYNEPTDKMKLKGITKGNPTFSKDILKDYPWDIAQDILFVKAHKKNSKDFIHGMYKFLTDGRIYATYNQTNNGRSGTRSGRLSCSKPNLQQVPKRGGFKKYIRPLYIPNEGYLMGRGDYSQIELILYYAHYAMGESGEYTRQRFIDDPNLDGHDLTAELNKCDRDTAKTLNYLVQFGGGKNALAPTLGISIEEAEKVLHGFHSRMPFIRYTAKCMEYACKKRGWVRTILGRRAHLNYRDSWKAVSRVVQGTAADLMKAAMVLSYESGLYSGPMHIHLQVHDETLKSVLPTNEGKEALIEEKYIMENAIHLFTDNRLKFKVPIKFEQAIGPNWFDTKPLKEWRI